MRIDPEEKQPKTYDGTEKYILRKAFDNLKPHLPVEVLWRQKNSFLMEWDTIGLIN
jgi:asparagine synthase (glutamine-hydrolysing)